MFDRSKQKKVQVGIKLSPGGFAIAEMDVSNSSSPMLRSCEYIPASSKKERASQLERFVKQHALKKRPCVLVLEDHSYSLLQMATPQVEEAELKSALRWSIKDQIDYPVDDAVIDLFHVPVPEHREAKMYAVASPRQEVESAVDFVNKSGLSLSVIDIRELCLGHLIEKLEGQERGIAVLHIGKEFGAISIYNSSALYLSRRIEFGLERIESIQQEETDSSVLATRLYEPIILELQRSLDFYESEYAKPPISKLIIAPKHPVLQGFHDYANSHSGYSVEYLNVGQVLADSIELSDENQASCLMAIAAASRPAEAVG